PPASGRQPRERRLTRSRSTADWSARQERRSRPWWPMPKRREIVKKTLQLLLVLSTWLALAGCPSPSVPVRPAPVAPPQIPALPAELVKREPNLLQRLQQLSTPSPETATAGSAT